LISEAGSIIASSSFPLNRNKDLPGTGIVNRTARIAAQWNGVHKRVRRGVNDSILISAFNETNMRFTRGA